MAFIDGATVENHDLRFLELRKAKVCDTVGPNVVNGLAHSHSYSLLFAISSEQEIAVLSESSLLDFQWSKHIHDQVVNPQLFATIKPMFEPTYISTSKGSGCVLAVFGRQCQTLAISLYDVDAIANSKRTTAFSHILQQPIPTHQGEKAVTTVEWHPEFSDSLVAVTCSDGTLITLAINVAEGRAAVLTQFTEKYPITCVSWSPKGKQLIVGKSNGCITFYKHANGSNFVEARNIAPPDEIKSYSVNSCSWILTSLILVTYCKSNCTDPDTKCVMISCPTKSMPEYHNFGKLCFESDVSQPEYYRCSYHHIKSNFILFSSNHSSEVSVIGSESADLSPASWSSYILDDDARLEMLSNDGSEIFPRGLAWSPSSSRVFAISETENHGGQGVPMIFVLNSSGVVAPYYAINKKSLFQNLPSLAPVQLPFQGASLTPVPVAINDTTFQATKEQPAPAKPTLRPVNVEKPSSIPVPQATTVKAHQPSTTLQQPVVDVNNTFRIAACEEVNKMNDFMTLHLSKANHIFNPQNLGATSQYSKLKEVTDSLLETLETVYQSLQDFEVDINVLKPWIEKSMHEVENVRSIDSELSDPKYLALARKKPLTPETRMKLDTIKRLESYVSQQLEEANMRVDFDYEEFTKRKANKNPPSDHSSDLLYKTIANNNKVIQALQMKISELEKLVEKKKYKSDFDAVNRSPNIDNFDARELEDEVSVQGILVRLQQQRIKDSPTASFEPSCHRAIGLNGDQPSPKSVSYRSPKSPVSSTSSQVSLRRVMKNKPKPDVTVDSEERREERRRQLSELDSDLQQLSLTLKKECDLMFETEKNRQKEEFDQDLQSISKQITDFSSSCKAMETSCNSSYAAAKTALDYFNSVDKVVGMMEQKLNKFISSSHRLIEAGHLTSEEVKEPLKELLKQWSIFKVSFVEQTAKVSSTFEILSAKKAFNDLIQSGEDLIIKSASCNTSDDKKALINDMRNFLLQNDQTSERILSRLRGGVDGLGSNRNPQFEDALRQRLVKLKADIGKCIKALVESMKAPIPNVGSASELVTVTKEQTPPSKPQLKKQDEKKEETHPVDLNPKGDECESDRTPSFGNLNLATQEDASDTPKEKPANAAQPKSLFGTPKTFSSSSAPIFGSQNPPQAPTAQSTVTVASEPKYSPFQQQTQSFGSSFPSQPSFSQSTSPFGNPSFGTTTNQPSFGSPPSFGQPAPSTSFGTAPAFGGSPSLGSGFGAAPSFGSSPAFGSSPSFGQTTTATGFAIKAQAAIGFGEIAQQATGFNQQSTGFSQQTSSPFGQNQSSGSLFGSPPASGFGSTGGTPDQFKSASFTQARR